MRTTRLAAALPVIATILVTACGQGPTALTVPEAVERGGEVVVEGYVFADGSGVRLCEAVAESFPPQCGGRSVEVRGVDADDFSDLQRAGDRHWSDTQRRLRGTLQEDALDVVEIVS